jgi:hypothetical protein
MGSFRETIFSMLGFMNRIDGKRYDCETCNDTGRVPSQIPGQSAPCPDCSYSRKAKRA